MGGQVDLRTRDDANVEPNNAGDPCVWMQRTVVGLIPLQHGSTVPWPPSRHRGRWEANQIELDHPESVGLPV